MTESIAALWELYRGQGPGLSKADLEEMEKNYALLVGEFGMAEDQLLATLESGLKHRLGINRTPTPTEHEPFAPVKLSELVDQGFYAVRAKVVKLFEPRSKKMHQTGLLGDESGVARFVTWSSRAPPTLEQGKTYLIDDLYASEYNDKINADLTNSTVEEINDDIKVAPAPGIMLIGAVTRVLSAGIVYRCAAKGCRKAVDIGPGGYMCPVHGILEDARVDLRARVVLDDGVQATTVFIPAAVLEKLTWISLAGAVDLAASTKVGGNFLVENKLRDSLFGKYLKVFVSPMSGQYYCQDAEVLHSFSDLEGVDTRASWELKEPPEWIPTEATRSFIAEMLQVKEILKEGPEKTSPTYAVLPSGERAARFVWAGVLVDVNRFNDSLTCNINDPTGILKLRVHRQYQAKAFQTLQNIKAPALIAVAGKLSLYKPPDGDKTYVSLVPSELATIDKATRLIWTEEALSFTEGTDAPWWSDVEPLVQKFIAEHRGDME